MPCYEWKRKTALDKKVDTKYGALNEDGTYGTRYEYEQTSPERTETFDAHGISYDQLQPFVDLVEVPLALQSPTTITDSKGRRWQGKIYRADGSPLDGVDLLDGSVTMKYPVKL